MRRVLGLALLGLLLAGCGDNSNAEMGLYRGRPIKTWILELKEGDAADREEVQKVLNSVGPANADLVPALRKHLKDEDPFVRGYSARLLGQIGPKAKDAYDDLSNALLDKNEFVLRETTAAIPKVLGTRPVATQR
jgi:HEAT repeat protein